MNYRVHTMAPAFDEIEVLTADDKAQAVQRALDSAAARFRKTIEVEVVEIPPPKS